MNIIGTDCSFWQDDNATPQKIDFGKMKANGAEFIIIRAGQNIWADPDFKDYWRESKDVLPRGSYWFYDSRVEPKRQADLWVSLFPSTGSGHGAGDLGELPLFCDFEDNYGGDFGTWKHWYTFIERLKGLVPGKEIGIYTAYYYWTERTAYTDGGLEYFKQYPLWVANYKVEKPLVPKPWTEWTFWQWTDEGDGLAYGVESKEIDLNYFNGDLAAFQARFQLENIPPHDGNIPSEPELPTGDNMYQMTPISSTRIRKDHTTYAETITTVNANVVVSGDELWTAPADGDEVKAGDQWLHVTYGNFTGWMAYIHKGYPICSNFKAVNEPDPTPIPTPTPTYQDVAVAVNVYDNQIVVLVNGEEWVRKV